MALGSELAEPALPSWLPITYWLHWATDQPGEGQYWPKVDSTEWNTYYHIGFTKWGDCYLESRISEVPDLSAFTQDWKQLHNKYICWHEYLRTGKSIAVMFVHQTRGVSQSLSLPSFSLYVGSDCHLGTKHHLICNLGSALWLRGILTFISSSLTHFYFQLHWPGCNLNSIIIWLLPG